MIVRRSKSPGGALVKPERRWSLHPFLFALFPVLFLYSQNIDWVDARALVKPIAVTLAAAAFVLAVSISAFRSSVKGALFASSFLILIYLYGPVMRLLQGVTLGGFLAGRTLVVFPIFCLGLVGVALAIARTRRDLTTADRYFRTLGVILAAASLAQIGVGHARAGRGAIHKWSSYVDRVCAGSGALPAMPDSDKPDIYYIILDNYSRSDVLQSEFGYDNSGFTEALKQRGVYTAAEGNCNYLGTHRSLPSSLNFDYLDTLKQESGIGRLNQSTTLAMISYSKVARLLKDAGYKFVAFPSGYSVTADVGADVVYSRSFTSLTEFDRVLLNSSMLSAPLAMLPHRYFSSVSEVESYRSDIRHTLRKLTQVPKMRGPKFAFVHLMVAHPPFVFDAEGKMPNIPMEDMATTDQLKSFDPKLYTDAITYLNREMIRVLDDILAESERPPIIIIQADHGASHRIDGKGILDKTTRHAILNAYCLPEEGMKALYPSISPVNTFRLVFNTCFGAEYPMLRDIIEDEISRDAEDGQ